MLRLSALLAALLAISTLAVAAHAQDDLELSDHSLVDTIVRTADGATVDRRALREALVDADFIVIGEKHDNPRHHAIQATLVDHVGTTGELQAVAFEMLDRDAQLEVTRHFQEGGTAVGLADAVGWERSGWGPWTWYGPIVHAARRHGATVVAADISRDDARDIYDAGFARFDAAFVRRTGLDTGLAPAEQAAREQAMIEAHCGHDLGDGAAAMVDVQRARDAMMADRLARLTGTGQGILITGNGHADVEQGVPAVLERLRPAAAVLSVGLIEVRPEWTEPPPSLPYDYVWLTPRAEPADFDYCDQLNSSRG